MTEKILNIAFDKLEKMYGENSNIKERFFEEADIFRNYQTALDFEYRLGLIRESLKKEGYYSYAATTYGSTLISYLLGVSDNNPLPVHFYCPTCKRVEFIEGGHRTEWDFEEKACPCGGVLTPCGFDIPSETHKYFLRKPSTTLFVGEAGCRRAVEIIKECCKNYFLVEESNRFSHKPVITMLQNGEKTNSEEQFLYESHMHISLHDKKELDELCDLERKYGKARLLDDGYLKYTKEGKAIKGLEKNGYKIPSFATKGEFLKICAIAHSTGEWYEKNGQYKIPLKDVPVFGEDIFYMLIDKLGVEKHIAYTISRRVRMGYYERTEKIPSLDMEILSSRHFPNWFMPYIKNVVYQISKAQGIELTKLELQRAWYEKREAEKSRY